MPRGRREHHDALGCMSACGRTELLDIVGIQRAVDQYRVPGALGQ